MPPTVRAMIATVKPISSLLLSAGLLLCGVGLLNVLLALRGSIEGFSDSTVGFIMSAYFAGFLLGTWLCPLVLQRIGHIRSYALFTAMASATALLHLMLIEAWAWAVLRVLTGMALVGVYMVLESWLNVLAPRESRGQIFAVYMVVNFLALAVSQFLLLLYPLTAFELFLLIAVLLNISLAPIMLTRLQQPQMVQRKSISPARLFRMAPVGVVGAVLSGVTTAAVWGMLPLLAQRLGLDSAATVQIMVAAIISGAVLQFPVGWWSDRSDRRKVLFLVSLAATLGAALLALVVQHQPTALAVAAVMVLLGGGMFCLYPISVAISNDQLQQDEIVGAASVLLLLHGIGAVFGPLLAGWAMQAIGPMGLALHFGVSLAALTLFAGYRYRVAVRPAGGLPRHRARPMLRTSPVVLDLMEEDLLLVRDD